MKIVMRSVEMVAMLISNRSSKEYMSVLIVLKHIKSLAFALQITKYKSVYQIARVH